MRKLGMAVVVLLLMVGVGICHEHNHQEGGGLYGAGHHRQEPAYYRKKQCRRCDERTNRARPSPMQR